MANIESQRKRNLRTERERLENRRMTSRIKTYFRRLESAVESGDSSSVGTEHQVLISAIDRAVARGAMHRNTGARRKARAARAAASVTEAS
jgi:small subunit ribosomal protein S20